MATITGSGTNDTLFGNGDAIGDVFFGLGGNDNILANGGYDTLDGGAGNDTLNGGAGYDLASYRTVTAVNVNLTTNIATGAGSGTDVLTSIEDVWGSDFNDTLIGNATDNYLFGYLGNDSISGGDAGDYLFSGGGLDTLNGDSGNDTLQADVFVSSTESFFHGGADSDTAIVNAASLTSAAWFGSLTYSLYDAINDISISFTDMERLIFTGNATGGIVYGGDGDDILTGLDGNDSFDGGLGNNIIDGGAGVDYASIDYSNRAAEVYLVNGGQAGQTYQASVGAGYGGSISNVEALNITGGLGNDTIGGAYAGLGFTLNGGGGADVAVIDASGVAASFYGGILGFNYLYDAAGGQQITLNDFYTLRFTGNATTGWVYGGNGDDTLTGLSGDDSLDGGRGDNVIDGGAGKDVANVDYSNRSSNLYLVNEGVAGVTYTATAGGVAVGTIRNVELLGITGGDGDDTIGGVVGMSGIYITLNGGEGSDTAIVDASALGSASWSGGAWTGLLYDNGGGGQINLASIESLNFKGNATADTVYGGDGNDTLTGLSGNDIFDGRLGNNIIDGGGGTDRAAFDFSNRSGNVSLVNGGVAATTYAATVGGVAAGSVRNVEALSITGGSGNDTIGGVVAYGVTVNLTGNDGTDVAVIDASGLTGSHFRGGLDYGNLEDGVTGSYIGLTGIEVLKFTGNANLLSVNGGAGNDSLTGLGGDDTFNGGTGDNVIDGGGGTRDLAFLDFSDRTGNVLLVNGGVAGTTYTATVGGVAAGTVRNVEALSLRGGSGNDTIGGVVFAGAYILLQGNDGLDVAVVDATGMAGGLSGGIGIGYLTGSGGSNVDLYSTEILKYTGAATSGTLTGGDYGDTLTGLSGNDSFDGSAGDDSLTGNAGADQLVGDWGNDTLSGGDGADALSGGGGDDSLLGGSRWDTLIGSDGDDTLDGGLDNDQMYGGAGNDVYYVDNSGDRTYETASEGTDAVVSSINWALSVDVEWLQLTGAATTGTGNGLGNLIIGNDAANTLIGGGGNDSLEGLAGSDSLDGGANNDVLSGGARWDTLVGGDGSDTLIGGLDNDQMYGGLGNDVYYVDNAGDRVNESSVTNEGTDTVYASITWNMTANVEALILEGTGHFSSTANSLANTMTGNSGNNTFTGGTGHDTLFGMDGNDSLDGGVDSDVLDGGNGNDTLVGGQRWDTLTGGAGDDVLDGGTENDRMSGNAGNDAYYVDNVGDRVFELTGEGYDTVYSAIDFALGADLEILFLTGTAITGTGNGLNNAIIGNAGNNVLGGGNGNDTLTGSLGADTLTGGTGRDDFVFGAAASNGTDRVTDFVHGTDRLVFAASSYGFTPGQVLTASQFTAGATAVGTSAQFIWDVASHHLYWDADGTGAGARTDLGLLDGATVTKDDLVFL